jgi:hypothetical protein
MKHRIIFGIIKTYKGIFSKRHIGNVQVIIIEMSKSFLMLNVIGQSKDDSNKHIAQMLLKGPSKFSNDFIDAFEEEGKFIQLEETLCDIPYENTDNFKVILKKKGKHLNSHYDIIKSSEYSVGDIVIYIMNGKFTPLLVEEMNNKTDIKMRALRKKAIVNPLLNKFKASLTR